MVPLKEQQFVPGSTFPVAQTAGHRRIPHFSCRGECFGSVKVPGTRIQRDLLRRMVPLKEQHFVPGFWAIVEQFVPTYWSIVERPAGSKHAEGVGGLYTPV